MWYYCLECGNVFEDGEAHEYTESVPSITGLMVTKRYGGCPVCGGEYQEADTCRKCGGAFAPEDLVARLYCRDCLEEFMNEETMRRYVSEDLENFAEWVLDWEV